MKTILIGKGRRVTLEELQAISIKDAVLQVFTEEDLPEVDCSDNADIDLLSNSSNVLASLTLLALNLAQERLLGCVSLRAVVNLVHVVNRMVETSANEVFSSLDASGLLALLVKCKVLPPNDEVPLHVVERSMWLAKEALSCRLAYDLVQIATPVASLSAERLRASSANFDEKRIDASRPHRGLVVVASELRALLHGSSYTGAAQMPIPEQHGPALESLVAVNKTMELELNCFELGDGPLNNAVPTLAAKQALDAVVLLIQASQQRMDITQALQGMAFTETTTLSEAVLKLQDTLTDEAKLGCTFVRNEMARVAHEIQQREQAKAAKAQAHQQNNSKQDSSTKNEFEGMTEAQKAKILKKRAEKLAKAQKKAASKKQQQKSPFGEGTLKVCDIVEQFPIPFCLEELEALKNQLLSGGTRRKPKIAKGTRDYLPEQMMIRQQAFSIIRRVFESHGAVEIDTPVFELKETLTGKYGEDSKLIYDLADQGGELLALRYDLTVPFARFLALNSVGNIKRFHIGKVYRRDQPVLSKGRYREFYQCDFDIAGNYGRMVPDAECLAVACDILDTLPIGDFQIKLNHRRLLDAILDLSGVPADKFRTICSAVDKLDKEPWEEVKREMTVDKGLEPEVADRIGQYVLNKGEPWALYKQLMDSKRFGTHKGANEAMEDLKIVFEYLEAMGKLKFISFDLSLARGLDYYTGIIYEAVCMSGNTQVGSIGGGGRYDNLVSMFQEAGKITPCVGVSIGIERVFTLMEARLREEQGGSIQQPNVNVLVATANEGMIKERMRVAKVLWDAKISAEFSQQENPSLKFELRDALARGIPFMVIVGEDEVREQTCKVKDLKARTEETVPMVALVSTLRQKGVIPVGCEFAAELLDN